MDFKDYQQQALRTALDGQPPVDRLDQAIHGMHDEARELDETSSGWERMDEISDCWWYVALAYDALKSMGYPVAWKGTDDVKPMDTLVIIACRMSGLFEAARWQGDEFDFLAFRWELFSYRAGLQCRQNNHTLSEIWTHNLEKLEDRHDL